MKWQHPFPSKASANRKSNIAAFTNKPSSLIHPPFTYTSPQGDYPSVSPPAHLGNHPRASSPQDNRPNLGKDAPCPQHSSSNHLMTCSKSPGLTAYDTANSSMPVSSSHRCMQYASNCAEPMPRAWVPPIDNYLTILFSVHATPSMPGIVADPEVTTRQGSARRSVR